MQPTQTSAYTRSDVRLRAALESDRAELEAIAAQIWDGDDYLPRVLNDWFADAHGGFWVATVHGRVVGVIKLTRFDDGEWWMEGLRVDPAYQGRGLGRILHHFGVNQLRQTAQGEIRFATASVNAPVLKLARETGFQRTAVFLPYGGDPLAEPVQRWRKLGADDLARVRAHVDSAPHYAAAQRSVEADWSFYRITDARLRDWLAEGLVYGWFDAGDVLTGAAMINSTRKERWATEPALKIGCFDAPDAALSDAVRDLRRLATALGRVYVRAKVLDDPARVAAVEAAGLRREWEGEVWLFARAIRLTEHADAQYDVPPSLN